MAQVTCVSRGDDSGTHKREKTLWKAAGIKSGTPEGRWYSSTGSGMGAAPNIPAGMEAYALAVRGTWISFKNKQNLKIVCEGDQALFNPYGVILINPQSHPHVESKLGQQFIDWLVSKEGQNAIGGFRLNNQILFNPNVTD